jgi:hypothetical protein
MAAYRGRRGGLGECSMTATGVEFSVVDRKIAARTLADGNDQLRVKGTVQNRETRYQ